MFLPRRSHGGDWRALTADVVETAETQRHHNREGHYAVVQAADRVHLELSQRSEGSEDAAPPQHAKIYRDASNDKIAVLCAIVGGYLVSFGHDDKGSYRVSPEKAIRTYKTLAGAKRAAHRWIA